MSRVRIHDLHVPMRDGVHLATDVLVAEDAPPRPAVVLRGPYSRASIRAQVDVVGLVRRGWAVVAQDVRGRFGSEGRFEPFHQEGPDGEDTVAWVARQPWCDGRVVGMGSSYLGLTQWRAAVEQPDALRAIAPMIAGGDVRDTWIYEGGALQLGFLLPWAAGMAATAPGATEGTTQRAADLASDWDSTYRIPLADHPVRQLFPPFERWLDRDDDAYWRPLDLAPARERLTIPGFHVAGWYDVFCEGTLRHFADLHRRSVAGAEIPHRLVVGPWPHTGVFMAGSADFDFGEVAATSTQGFDDEVLHWLEAAVAGEPVEPGIRVFVMGTGQWRDLAAWPPPSTPTRLFLTSRDGANGLAGDGALLAGPDGAGTDHYRYDPDDPVPSRGGRSLGQHLPLAGPVDQRAVEERDDVLVYTSPPLDTDLTVLGLVRAEIVFESDGRSADVTVKLVDVWPDGTAYNVVDSVARVALVPGEPRRVEVAVGSTAMCFRVGHRIRVEVSSSNFPRLDRNPSTGVPPRDATELRAARQTVHHGGRAGSRIILPVVEGRLPQRGWATATEFVQ